MAGDTDTLKDTLRRWTLLLGVLQITVGCLAGLIPPSAVAWFRGIVMAHIEFTINGILVIVFGFLLREIRRSRRGSRRCRSAPGRTAGLGWQRVSAAHRRSSCRPSPRNFHRLMAPTTRWSRASSCCAP